MKALAFAGFINFFMSHENFEELEKIIIDGEVRESTINCIEAFFPDCPEITTEPKADLHYNIVNKADSIAHILYHYYKKPQLSKKRYRDNLITPKIEDYHKLFERIQEEYERLKR